MAASGYCRAPRICSKYLRGTDGNLGNTSERRGGMAIVITRVCVCVCACGRARVCGRVGGGVKYDCCGGLVVRKMFLN